MVAIITKMDQEAETVSFAIDCYRRSLTLGYGSGSRVDFDLRPLGGQEKSKYCQDGGIEYSQDGQNVRPPDITVSEIVFASISTDCFHFRLVPSGRENYAGNEHEDSWIGEK